MDEQLQARLTEIQTRYLEMLMSKPNVIGVGIGKRKRSGVYLEEVCIVVMVTQKVPFDQLHPEDRIPQMIEGIPIDVQEFGSFSAF
ncbi:MAG: hypothetical protein MUF87_03330 [Anaerolineae bacterium]|jgi:hypothetical protein|nr:hypothetical protein [Anaerolineae bacterium]